MAVNAGIRLVDEMTAPINHILDVMSTMIDTMASVESIGESAFNSESIVTMRQHIETAQIEMQELSNNADSAGKSIKRNASEQENFNNKVAEGSDLAQGLFDKFKTGIGILGAGTALKKRLIM